MPHIATIECNIRRLDRLKTKFQTQEFIGDFTTIIAQAFAEFAKNLDLPCEFIEITYDRDDSDFIKRFNIRILPLSDANVDQFNENISRYKENFLAIIARRANEKSILDASKHSIITYFDFKTDISPITDAHKQQQLSDLFKLPISQVNKPNSSVYRKCSPST